MCLLPSSSGSPSLGLVGNAYQATQDAHETMDKRRDVAAPQGKNTTTPVDVYDPQVGEA